MDPKITLLLLRAGDARGKQHPKQTHPSSKRHRHICEFRNALCIEDGASNQREHRYDFYQLLNLCSTLA